MQLTGIHHVTAVTARVRDNLKFYTDTLGMRLVKKTVNQDDVSAYHLFYADALGSPGSDLTFFDWPMAASEHRGNHSISRTALRVSGPGALDYWRQRLLAEPQQPGWEQRVGEIRDVGGRLSLDFEDAEGQRLRLVDDGGAGEAHPWAHSPVPLEHQIRGLGPVTVTLPRLSPTDKVLTTVLGMRLEREVPDPDAPGRTVYVYAMGEGGAAAELHVAVRPDLPPARFGAGGVHHVAFRVPDEAQYHAWTERFSARGLRTSGEVDRFYFRSLYYREPQGILFELATDGPGFATDEPLEHLGQGLSLPPFLESRRAQIEAGLKPL